MKFTDALELGKPRRTKEGYLAVRARAARTGVYQYDGREIDPDNKHGLRDSGTVNVLRDEATVFDAAAVRTFIGKPITVDHPSEAVTADNWKQHSRGAIMGALRDGDYLAFDLLVMDKDAIADIEAGKRELSNGYRADIEVGDFTAPDGTKCQARQARITDGNHVAIVDKARGGGNCRIADGGNDSFEICDFAPVILIADAAQEQSTMKDFLTLDGLKVDLTDADAVKAAFAKLQQVAADANTAKDKALTDVATLTTDKAALEAKVATLETQLKDAALTPAKLREAARAYAEVCDKAKALGVTVTDEMDEAAIQKAVVTAKIGDAAKDWTDAQIAASFATLAADVKPAANVQPLGRPASTNDGRTAVNDARKAWLAAKETAYRATAGA